MGLVNKIGDFYHKNIYSYYSSLTSKLTDATDYCFSDLLLGASCIPGEVMWLTIGATAYASFLKTGNMKDASSDFAACAIAGIAISTGIVMTTYMTNKLRQPAYKRMGIKPAELEMEEELRYSIDMCNALSDSPKMEFADLNDKLNGCIDKLVFEIEGYNIPHAKKVKKSAYSNRLLQKRIGGLMNPFIQEIVVTSDLFLNAIAHEKAHLCGYPNETYAQLLGFMCMQKSQDPSIRYLGYFHRLYILRSHYFDELLDEQATGTNADKIKDDAEYLHVLKSLEARGLNERTLKEFKDISEMMIPLDPTTRYGKFRRRFADGIRSLFLKLSGEKNLRHAYNELPLRLMSAYDPPKRLSTEECINHASS